MSSKRKKALNDRRLTTQMLSECNKTFSAGQQNTVRDVSDEAKRHKAAVDHVFVFNCLFNHLLQYIVTLYLFLAYLQMCDICGMRVWVYVLMYFRDFIRNHNALCMSHAYLFMDLCIMIYKPAIIE